MERKIKQREDEIVDAVKKGIISKEEGKKMLGVDDETREMKKNAFACRVIEPQTTKTSFNFKKIEKHNKAYLMKKGWWDRSDIFDVEGEEDLTPEEEDQREIEEAMVQHRIYLEQCYALMQALRKKEIYLNFHQIETIRQELIFSNLSFEEILKMISEMSREENIKNIKRLFWDHPQVYRIEYYDYNMDDF